MNRHNIALGQKVVKFHKACPKGLFRFRVPGPVVIEDLHAIGGLAAPRQAEADAAQPEYPQGFGREFHTEVTRGIEISPLARHDGLVHEKHFSGHGNHEAKGDICRGLGHGPRRKSHGNAQAGGGGDIDIVIAHGKLGNDVQMGAFFQEIPVDPVGEGADQGMVVFGQFRQFHRGHGPVLFPEGQVKALFPQQADPGPRVFSGYENFLFHREPLFWPFQVVKISPPSLRTTAMAASRPDCRAPSIQPPAKEVDSPLKKTPGWVSKDSGLAWRNKAF